MVRASRRVRRRNSPVPAARRAKGYATAALVGLAATPFAACGPPPSPDPAALADGPGTAAEDAWTASLRARSDSARTVRAALELDWTNPATGEKEGCSGSLTYERPGNVRMRARAAAFFTVFDLVANADDVWLDVPREELTVTGRRDDPVWGELPVSPDPLLVALLADPWGGEEPGPVRFVPGGAEIEVRGADWTLWMDARTTNPVRYRSGDLELEWSEWTPRWGVPWPHDIRVRSRAGNLRVRLGRFTLNRNLRPGLFEFQTEEDRCEFTPKEAKAWWAGESTGYPDCL